ncbi:MAG TPA: DNA ligase D [Isosphaeraceae bacterium]|nr:DNA ligase D [Isosphaeraceae bacterium]
MGLDEYRRKRDFHKTPEPRGKRAGRPHGQLAYIIQKHDASHLHYDFRLELNGVLKSWAVPKGPDPDPAKKRLAMQVEDHPLEYGGFEGIIPEGEYGGGTVMLWDKGVWEPIGDAAKGLKDGHLKFTLRGEKLQGAWMLVRKGGRRGEEGERVWFLFKERDEFARPGESITEEMPLSVTTGRDLDEIAAQSDRVWGPGGEVRQNGRKKTGKPATASSDRRKAVRAPSADGIRARRRRAPKATAKANGREKPGAGRPSYQELLEHPGVQRATLPRSQSVELATLVDAAPPGDEWLHEIKFDGYRMVCRIEKGKARFISRNGNDWTHKLPELAEAAGGLAIRQAMLDGEVVSLKPDGTTGFQDLQNAFQAGRTGELVYYVFDVLHLDGRDVTGVPLEARKEILKRAISQGTHKSIRYSDHLQGTGREIIDQACHLHLEGIISKRRNSLYRPGRGLDWLKVKCLKRQEFVIGGFTKPSGSRSHFGALLLGYYDHGKKLIYAGRVGTGFDQRMLATMKRKLTGLVRHTSPYADTSLINGQAADVSWVKPVLVAEVEFANWTNERLLRHATFQGLREDKPATAVVHDEPLSLSDVKAMENGREAAAAQKDGKAVAFPGRRNVRKPTADAAANDEWAGVRLSHPDKILYPEHKLTKRDLANYYLQVADWMLTHVAGRPLAIVRCPGGSDKPCFFQKHPGEGASKHLRQVNISENGAADFHASIDDASGLIALVQMGVLEIHAWGSRVGRLEKPDRLIFDLDPDPSVDWPDVVNAARAVRLLLEELGLASFLKTTGGKGLHLVVPVQPRAEWDEAKAFCRAVADFFVRAAPDRFIATMTKAARKGKIFIDYLRNGRGATAVAPYSTRAKAGATVSAPIAWEELTASLHSDHFTIENLPARLSKLKRDPWADMATTKQSITAAMLERLAAR